jgi:uncharacterized surface protein with fasciclin (FAS1) repeats
MLYSTLVSIVTLSANVQAQTLLEAISNITELSSFAAFYSANTALAERLYGNSNLWPITVLVPNNDAFATYQTQHNNISLTEVPADVLSALIQYHTLVSNLTSTNFTEDGGGGVTIPTLMTDPPYNNRSVGPELASKFGGKEKASGQVVFVKPGTASSPSRYTLMSRQNSASTSSIRSGLSSNVGLITRDDDSGLWEGGRFHIIDGLLTPPDLCKTTIRAANLTGLDNALNRSGLWPALDGHPNITCLGPSNNAFSNAGSPDSILNKTALQGALLFHTLPEVAYSDYLYDGQTFNSLQNMTVRVTIKGEGAGKEIFFNNAKVLDANIL